MERSRDEQIQIANTIMQQLGGHKFKVMTGARNFIAIDNGLTFAIPGTFTKSHINKIRVILDPSDTYTMSFWNYRKQKIPGPPSMKKIAEHDMIYNDMLQEIFTAETGLDTHL